MPRVKSVSAKKAAAKKKAPTEATVEAWSDEKLLELFENRDELNKAISIVVQCQLFLNSWAEYAKTCRKTCEKRRLTDFEHQLLAKKLMLAAQLDLSLVNQEIRTNWDYVFSVNSGDLFSSLAAITKFHNDRKEAKDLTRGESDGT